LEAKRDGAAVAAALLGSAVPVDPGTHHLEVSAPGFRTFERDVALNEGARETVAVELTPLGAEAAQPSRSSAPPLVTTNAPPAADRDGRFQKPLGLAVAGLGIVVLGVGTYFAFDAKSSLSDRDGVCPSRKGCSVAEGAKNEQLTKDARKSARFANIGWASGAVLAAAGVTLWLTAPSEHPTAGASTRVTPWAGAGAAGCVVEGAF
jgi:hypothetical protein